MERIFEAYSDETSIKDGGFIFQAILNYDLQWSIVDGHVSLDQKNIQGWLKQVDAFPDMRFDEGYATLTYVLLSEVNLLKRKFELASEAIKRIIKPDYAREMDGETVSTDDSKEIPKPVDGELDKETLALPEPEKQKQLGPGQTMLNQGQTKLNQGQHMLNQGQPMLNQGQPTLPPGQKRLPGPTSERVVNEVLYTTKLTSNQIEAINDKYFKGTSFDVNFVANNIVLREVSTSGLDTGLPGVTLKLSTGMVDTLDGKAINSWDNFKVVVTAKLDTVVIDNSSTPKISEILVYDAVDNSNELIFRTILPSVILEFKGDRVKIDNYSSRSSQISVRSNIDFDNLFNIDETPKEVEEPEEGENTDENKEEPTKNIDFEENQQINKIK
jgi:hypothetical protein